MTKALELAKFGRETPPAGVVVGDSDAQTLSSKTFSDGPVFSSGTVNAVAYLNASKVFSTSDIFVFDGTNLGVGKAAPAYKLDVAGTINSSAANATGYNLVLRTTGISTGRAATGLTNTSGDFYTGIEGSTAGQTLTGSAAYAAYLGTFTANPLYLTTSGQIRATLNASGNLGLGTEPSTGSRLQVLGLTDFWHSTNTLLRVQHDGTRGRLQAYTGGAVGNIGINSEGGNVGIGTDSPAWRLTTKASASSTAAVFLYDGEFAGTSEVNVGLRWYNGGNPGDIPQVLLRGYGTTNYTGNFAISLLQGGTYPNPLIERFTIQGNTGNVGIGDSNPGSKLSVAGSATFYGASIDSETHNGIRVGSNSNYYWEISREGVSSGHLRFVQNNNNTINERMRLDSNGNVLIDAYSNTGGGKLDLTSNATAAIQARSIATGTGDGTADITVTRAVTSGANWWANARYDAYSHTWGRGGSANVTPGMLLNGSGNLAIGTTGNTAQKLNVNGAIWLLGNDDANYSTLISARYDSSNSFTMQTRLNSGTMSEFLALYSDGGGGNPRLALAPNGWKVGVGTTDPKNPLHVVDSRNYLHSTTADHTTNMPGIRVTNSNNGDNWAGIWFATGSGLGTHWSGIAGARTASATTWGTHLAFYTHEDATVNVTQATERMRLDSGGKLGIATVSPAATLHVVGTGSILAGTNPALGVSNPSYSGLAIGFDGSPNLAQIVATNPSTASMAFYTKPNSGSAPIQRMLISYDGIISTPNNTFSDDRGFLSRNGTWPHSNGGYANYGSTYPYRSFSREANGNLTEYAFNMDIGTDGYGSSTQYWYLSIPTGATTWMATYDVEVWSAGWNWSQVTGYRRWTVHSQSNSWTVSLREDNAGASMVYLSCYATPVGSSSVKFGFAMTGGRGGFYVRITTVGTAFDGASSYQTNTNPF